MERRVMQPLAGGRAVVLAATGVVAAVVVAARALDRPLHAATGLTAHSLCTERFVAGRDPAVMLREHIREAPGTRLLGRALRHHVDAARGEVRASVLGVAASRARFVAGRG